MKSFNFFYQVFYSTVLIFPNHTICSQSVQSYMYIELWKVLQNILLVTLLYCSCCQCVRQDFQVN